MGLDDGDALAILRAAVDPDGGSDELIHRFYTHWFAFDTSARDLFPPDMEKQRAAFAHALTWLFGELADTGIAIPTELTLGTILKLVLAVLGLTWERAKAEAVKMIGPTAVGIIAKLIEYIQALWTGGPEALWEKVKEDLGNLKAMVIDAIQDWLITTLIKKAVAKIVLMFNPVGAIVQAIMMIYEVVMFVIDRAKQLLAFIESVVDSIALLASGNTSTAAKKIEEALGRLVPVLIGLLANIIGLGGIGAKIKETINKVQNLVWVAIRKLIKKGIEYVKKMWAKLTGKKEDKPDERTEEQKKADLDKALNEAQALQQTPKITEAQLKKGLLPIKQKYKMASLEFVVDSTDETKETVHVEGQINPGNKTSPTPIDKNSNIRVQFNSDRHTLKGVRRGRAYIDDLTTILTDVVNIEVVKGAAQAAYVASQENAGEFEAEGVNWKFKRDGPKDKPPDQYLHIYPTHTAPKAITLGRAEYKAVKSYQDNVKSGKNHDDALAFVKGLATRLPGVYCLSINALFIINLI